MSWDWEQPNGYSKDLKDIRRCLNLALKDTNSSKRTSIEAEIYKNSIISIDLNDENRRTPFWLMGGYNIPMKNSWGQSANFFSCIDYE